MEATTTPGETHGSMSPATHGSPTTAKANGQKRKHNSLGANHASDAEEHGDYSHKKRACNECRQQKLKCDVVPEPFTRCSRCRRLSLECRIDANFKRVGKRSKTAQMEREIVELRARLAGTTSPAQSSPVHDENPMGFTTTLADNYVAHQGIAGSLLDLRHSTDASRLRNASSGSGGTNLKVLGNTTLGSNQIEELFQHYFKFYHPFLPVLDTDKSPDYFYELSPLLYWTVICVAARRYDGDPTLLTGIVAPFKDLIWSTIAAVPQNYHISKALAILCTWPLPTKSTSTDQTYLLSGLMLQIALQAGLHRPSYAQDFSKVRVELQEDEVADRLNTWAVCNVVAQTISTSYGLPPASVYDYTLESLPEPSQEGGGLPPEIYWRLQIERFTNKVSQMLYNNKTDPIGIAGAQERAAWTSLLVEDYRDLEQKVARYASSIALLHLQAAGMHLRLAVFFDSPSAPNYVNDLLQLYFSATTFLSSARELGTSSGHALKYATRYLVHMILAGGFTLMKLLNSFFARHIDVDKSRLLFNSTIHGIRSISVANNDLPARLAEVLAQLWRTYGAGMTKTIGAVDNSLQLKVRRRMSMSLVYDSVWRWREEFQFKGDGTTADLDSAVNNPTDPDVSADDPGSNGLDPTLADLSVPSAGLNDSLVDYNYEVFDPLTWMLDGSMGSFPYNGIPDGVPYS